MHDKKKTQPLNTYPTPKKCPVCGYSTYSSNGIHPQCAVTQADEPRKARLASAKRAKAQARTTSHESEPIVLARYRKSVEIF